MSDGDTNLPQGDPVEHLAHIAGIEASYRDFYGQEHFATRETKLRLLAAMGYATESDEALLSSLRKAVDAPWLRVVEPVLVTHEGQERIDIMLRYPVSAAQYPIFWQVHTELGDMYEGEWSPSEGHVVERHATFATEYERREVQLQISLPLGYHELRVWSDAIPFSALTTLKLIVAPLQCYLPRPFDDQERIFGIALQAYSLRTEQDWGIGDFAALADFGAAASKHGVAALGVNPLHELDPSNPAASSPYSPSSRRTINPAYISIPAVPDFLESSEAQALAASPDFAQNLERVRSLDLIEYATVSLAKREVLAACYRSFSINHLQKHTERAEAFLAFRRDGGVTLERLCLFNALAEHFGTDGPRSWHTWPEAYRSCNTPEVHEFAAVNGERVTFFTYVQWEAERQLSLAEEACRDMTVGLYRDLAVGVDSNSADTWACPDLFAQTIGVGAPPDPLSLEGQGWGLVPFLPKALRDDAYAEFAALLRANMRHAGALRIDHAMALLRLYWIPNGYTPHEGAYVRYPVDELFGIVALESYRARCIVIGEDLGTVPDGFRERLAAAELLSYRLLRFERENDGGFVSPERYPRLALASAGTHDLPPLAGFWRGSDIDVRMRLGLNHNREAEEAGRTYERERLLGALIERAGLSQEQAEALRSNPEEADVMPLIVAAYRYVALAPSLFALALIEDILCLTDSINVPGTVDEHPNWRRRLPITVQRIAADPRLAQVTHAMAAERSRNVLI